MDLVNSPIKEAKPITSIHPVAVCSIPPDDFIFVSSLSLLQMASSEQAAPAIVKKGKESARPVVSKKGSNWGWPRLTSKPSQTQSLGPVKDSLAPQPQDPAGPPKDEPGERRSSEPNITQQGSTHTARVAPADDSGPSVRPDDPKPSTIPVSDEKDKEASAHPHDQTTDGKSTTVAEPTSVKESTAQDAEPDADAKEGKTADVGRGAAVEQRKDDAAKDKTETEENAVAAKKNGIEAVAPSSTSDRADTPANTQADVTASKPDAATPEGKTSTASSAAPSGERPSETPSAASSGRKVSENHTAASQNEASEPAPSGSHTSTSEVSTLATGRKSSKTPSIASGRRASKTLSMIAKRKRSKASSLASGRKTSKSLSTPSQGTPQINIIRASEDRGVTNATQVDAKDFGDEPSRFSADADMSPPAIAGPSNLTPEGAKGSPKLPTITAPDLKARLGPSKASAAAAESLNDISKASAAAAESLKEVSKLPARLVDAPGPQKRVSLRHRIRPKVLRTPVLTSILGRPLGEQVSPVLRLFAAGMSPTCVALNIAGNMTAGVTASADPGKDGASC